MANEIAKKKENAVVSAGVFDEVAGDGFGSLASTDYIIPRLAILGELSPQISSRKMEHIEGAEVGDMVDVVMGDILAKQGSTFDFLPVSRVKEAILWKSGRGGLMRREPLNETMDSFCAKLGIERSADGFEYKDKEGNEWIETHQYYGLLPSHENRWVFLPIKKSGLKVARKWFTKATSIKLGNGQQAPLYFKTYKIGSFLDNGNGNEWYNLKVDDGPLLQDYSDNWHGVFESAKLLSESIASGDAVGDVREDDPANTDEIPF